MLPGDNLLDGAPAAVLNQVDLTGLRLDVGGVDDRKLAGPKVRSAVVVGNRMQDASGRDSLKRGESSQRCGRHVFGLCHSILHRLARIIAAYRRCPLAAPTGAKAKAPGWGRQKENPQLSSRADGVLGPSRYAEMLIKGDADERSNRHTSRPSGRGAHLACNLASNRELVVPSRR